MQNPINVLGIETSCDETSVSIVKNGTEILLNIVASQEKIHSKYFGVVPELASRAHTEKINHILKKCFVISPDKIDAIAYTAGPGLLGSLIVGKLVAQTISYVYNKPLIPVNHIEGHIFSIFLENKKLKPPFLSLVVSGGHTELIIFEDFGKYNVLGKTRDDACGEAFDKIAKLLKIGYPGGPKIDKLSKKGNPEKIKFPRPYLWNSWDFSFSGLKTSVLYYLQDKKNKNTKIQDICASFQQAVIDTLVNKTIVCAKKFNLKNICIVGGVAANSGLRKEFFNKCKKEKINVFFPSIKLCTDNAAMIASVGYFIFKKTNKDNLENNQTNKKYGLNPNMEIKNW